MPTLEMLMGMRVMTIDNGSGRTMPFPVTSQVEIVRRDDGEIELREFYKGEELSDPLLLKPASFRFDGRKQS